MVRRGEFETLQNRGLPLGILVDTNNKQKLGDVSRFEYVEHFDFSRPTHELVGLVAEVQRRFGIRCLFNVIEFYVAQTACVAEQLGIPNLSSESARLCLDKNLMRDRFRQRVGPHSTARFQQIHSEGELVHVAEEIGYPVFLQPSNVSASMWSTRNNDKDSLLRNYRSIVEDVPKYYERLGKKETKLSVLLAEYVEGKNTSIDCLVQQDGSVVTTPIVDVLTGRDVGINDYHHFARILPSNLTTEEQTELEQLAIEGVRSLDMTCCAAHVEFIGNRLGEIAARPGGNRARILELAYGVDELYACYQALTGQAPTIAKTRHNAAAILTPFPSRSGTIQAINYLEQISELPGYLYHEVRAQLGAKVGLASGGYRAPLYIEFMSTVESDVRSSVNTVASWTDLYAVE